MSIVTESVEEINGAKVPHESFKQPKVLFDARNEQSGQNRSLKRHSGHVNSRRLSRTSKRSAGGCRSAQRDLEMRFHSRLSLARRPLRKSRESDGTLPLVRIVIVKPRFLLLLVVQEDARMSEEESTKSATRSHFPLRTPLPLLFALLFAALF